jgi:GntR family transcriptional repressor for pyruvate dehydrogenase complex
LPLPAKAEFEAVRKTKVYEKVAEQIQRLIRDGLLKPGDMLPPERELAETFQVSRSSLRDAIRALELMGMVEARQGEGTVVREPSGEAVANPLTAVLLQQREFVSELLELRGMIEPTLAARAATHADANDLVHLEDILRRQKEKVDRGELAIEEDSEFHYSIARASNNKVVLQVVDVFMDLLRESRKQSLQVEGRLQKSLVSHQQILRAIAQHDAAAAENAMRRHIQEIEAIVLQEL